MPTATQAHELEQLQQRLAIDDGSLLWLARQCAQDAALVHLGALRRVDAGDVLFTLREYERFLKLEGLELQETER